MTSWLRDAWDFMFALPSSSWTAIATWVGVAVAVVTIAAAGKYATKQINAARALEDERAQPNIVAFMQDDPVHWTYEDLVIKNFGQTPAYEIEIIFEPDLTVTPYTDLVTGKEVTTLRYPKQIPFLAPGQEWRTAWDSGRARAQYVKKHPEAAGLMTSFSATIKYRDSRDGTHTTHATLDWSVFESRMKVTTKSVHHIAKTLARQEKKIETIGNTLGAISTRINDFGNENRGIWVYPSSDARQREFVAKEREEHEKEANARKAQSDKLLRQLVPHEFEDTDQTSQSNPERIEDSVHTHDDSEPTE